jgi:hypothetical protein
MKMKLLLVTDGELWEIKMEIGWIFPTYKYYYFDSNYYPRGQFPHKKCWASKEIAEREIKRLLA